MDTEEQQLPMVRSRDPREALTVWIHEETKKRYMILRGDCGIDMSEHIRRRIQEEVDALWSQFKGVG